MHDEPRPGADPGDLTERHATTPDATPESPEGQASPATPENPASTGPTWPSATPTTPESASVDPWAPSTGTTAPSDPALDRFAPSPEPRSDWARSWDQTPPVTPERWYEPAPAPVPASAVPVPPRKRTGGSSLLAAALLSAVLASGGTVLALSAAGALDRPAAPTSAAVAQGTNVGALQPVSIDEQSATIAVASKVSPAVVRITVTGTTNDGNNGVIPETGVGSGVIFDSNGWILTNHHVVEGGEKFDVELKDGRVLSGTVYGIDTLTDLAIVKVNATGLPSAAIGESDALKVGQLVVAIGSPLGTYSNSVTSGIVSAKGRSITTEQQRVADQPHPDGCRDQPGQLGRSAARRGRQRHRHQHRDRLEQQRHRVRHPDRRRPADHGPGAGRPAAQPAVPRHPLRVDHAQAGRRPEAAGHVRARSSAGSTRTASL